MFVVNHPAVRVGQSEDLELVAAMQALGELQGKDPLVPTEVTAEVVSQVIADWTGIPLGKMVSDEASTLL